MTEEQRIYKPRINQILKVGNGTFNQTSKGLAVFGLGNGKYHKEDKEGNSPYFGSPTAIMKVIPTIDDEARNFWFSVEGGNRPRIIYLEKPLIEVMYGDIYRTGLLRQNELVDYNGDIVEDFPDQIWTYSPPCEEFDEEDPNKEFRIWRTENFNYGENDSELRNLELRNLEEFVMEHLPKNLIGGRK